MKYRVAVRALCEFTAKVGDLDLRFTPSPSAAEGMEGHLAVAARRDDSYEPELPLSGNFGPLLVRGRADGYDPVRNRLEEVKTFRGDIERVPDNHRALHRAQLKIYGWLLCRERDLEGVELALVYFDIVKRRETPVIEYCSAEVLRSFFEQQCDCFLRWAEQQGEHRRRRDQALSELAFPHARFRSGQRELAEAVYKTTSTGRCLLTEAPTGIGKTLGTLFPVLKAMPERELDKVFCLSAKTPGRRLFLEALESLGAVPLRTLELVAREKSCEHPDKACHGEACPLARGFYDRLPDARQAAAQAGRLTQTALREIALAHDICPYFLSQEMTRWSDVVVGDYNYYFDLGAMLHSLTTENQWRTALLVDEAHNLVDRARGMYSASLDQFAFRRVKKLAPAALKTSLEKVNRQWSALNREYDGGEDYRVVASLPVAFCGALQGAVAAMTELLGEDPMALDGDLMQFYFDSLHFLRVEELLGDDFLVDIHRRRPPRGRAGTVVCLRNVVPAALLRPRFATAQSAVLFSATLKPPRYYADLLGLPDDTAWMDVPSPFSPEQLQVHLDRRVSTRFHDRGASLAPIAERIACQFQARPGNYLAFFSSYHYLEQVLSVLTRDYPGLPVWAQDRRMDEAARNAFLERFQEDGEGIGFAVLGGAFAEGIDLPGNRLIGAFIATLGLPQVNPVNEQFRERMGSLFGEGYDYTYLYPGLSKVVQAAGRVIRTETDSGVVHLIDDRFARSQVRALLPAWWRLEP